MSNSNTKNFFSKFKNMPVDSIPKTILVAIGLCLFCSMIVSFAAVNLKSIQDVNKIRDKQKNILQVAGVYYDGINIEETFLSFDVDFIDVDVVKFQTELFYINIHKEQTTLFLNGTYHDPHCPFPFFLSINQCSTSER